MFATVPAVTKIVNLGFRANDRSTSGQRTRFSTATNAASNSTDVANATTVATDVQPQVGARSKVNVNNPIPMMIHANPARSIRRGTVLSEDSVMLIAPITSESTVRGTLSQKIERQPNVSVSSPPISGPAALPKPAIPEAIPMAWLDLPAGKALVITLTDTGK